jgi:hypothetical protein
MEGTGEDEEEYLDVEDELKVKEKDKECNGME